MAKLPLRNDLPVEETWDLSLLFETQEEYLEAVEKFKVAISDFNQKYKHQLTDATKLQNALIDLEEINAKGSPIFMYGSLGYEVDKLNENYETNAFRLSNLSEWMGEKLSFFESEVGQLPEAVIQEVAESENGQVFEHYLQAVLRKKQIMLAPEIEETLSALANSIFSQNDLYNQIKFQDMQFDDFEAEGETFHNSFAGFEQDYEGHRSYAVRHEAWKSFHDGLARYQHTAANNYINLVKTDKKMATLRGFDSVIDYLLFNQRMTRQGYNLIIDTLTEELAPVMQRYAKMMQAEHNLERISLADIKMAFTPGDVATISIEESRAMLEDGLGVLGDEYLSVVKRAFDERWIDYPMNETKSTGGFCATTYRGPSYILLNWTGLLSEVLVLAHELGHAGHFNLAHENQLAITPEPSLYFTEAPSTANEVIMCQYLLNRPIDDSAKRALLAEFVSRTYYHNMVTHLLEADFQRKVYEAIDADEMLNANRLNAFFQESLENFWGDALDINPGAELTWMRQPHYFMGLYPYTYSAGLTVGTQVGSKIAAGDQAARDAWLETLKAGGTLTPLELAAKAGVDMQDEKPLRQAISYITELLDQIEAYK